MQRLIRAALVVLLSGVFLFLGTAQVTPPSPAPMSLTGINAPDLARSGITLLPPQPGEVPIITADQVRSRAQGFFAGAPIREVVLAHAKVPNRGPPIDQLVWVVNFDPAGLTVPSTDTATFVGPLPLPKPVGLALAFFDARTGEGLYGIEAAFFPPPTPGQ